MNDESVTYFAETDSRGKKVKFGIKQKDRAKHVYVIGKTGMGKSTLLENMAAQDIMNGNGMCFIDPHGKTADLLLEYVPEHRLNDVVYFAPFDLDHPISFNVLEQVDPDKRHLVVSGLMSTFKKIWADAWSARMEYILGNTLLALLEYPGATLLGVNRMFSDKDYRKKVVDNITDASVKSFWVDEFAKYTDRFASEATPAIQNKIGQFTSNALIRNMIGQPKSSFDIRKMMDEKKILIVNLSKGRVGEQNANLLGGMLITKIYLAAMSRADTGERHLKNLPNFYLYVDEFQSFANKSFADILSEARKYKLNLTMAHQYIEQMEEEVRAAVFGNIGTMIVFRVGATDAEVLEKEFAPIFTAQDIVNLGFIQIYLKLMIDGISSSPFSATTLPPIPHPEVSHLETAMNISRKNFTRPRFEVEKEINEWYKPVTASAPKASNVLSKEGVLNDIKDRGVKDLAKKLDSPERKPISNTQNNQTTNGASVVNTQSNSSVNTAATNSKPIQNFQNQNKAKMNPDGENRMSLAEALKSAMKEKQVKDSAPQTPKAEIKPTVPVAESVQKPVQITKPIENTQTHSTQPKLEPVSLSALTPKKATILRPNPTPINPAQSSKGPKEKNLSDLKNALSSLKNVLDKEQKPVKSESVEPAPRKEEPKEKVVKEVPEETLRRVLEVDEN